jgi:dihydrofolate reductase
VRKLKLQMQMSIDGFVAGPKGELDWMTSFDKDKQLGAFVDELADTSDTILLGRKMAPGFMPFWESVSTKPDSMEYDFAQKMVRIPKIVFSKTLRHIDGQNVRVENGDLGEAVNQLKRQPGKDLLVYGGASFVSSLVQHDLIDELNLFINTVAIGEGFRIFPVRKALLLKRSLAYPSGIVVNTYGIK